MTIMVLSSYNLSFYLLFHKDKKIISNYQKKVIHIIFKKSGLIYTNLYLEVEEINKNKKINYVKP